MQTERPHENDRVIWTGPDGTRYSGLFSGGQFHADDPDLLMVVSSDWERYEIVERYVPPPTPEPGPVGVCPECGGPIMHDSDYCLSGPDGDEVWWNYRCQDCREMFRHSHEFEQAVPEGCV